MIQLDCTYAEQHSYRYLRSHLAASDSYLTYEQGRWLLVNKETATNRKDGVLTVSAQALTLYQLTRVCDKLDGHLQIGSFKTHRFNEMFGDCVVVTSVDILDERELAEKISSIAQQYGVEIAIQRAQPKLREPGLLVMDMDSTVIQIECIDEIARFSGVGDAVAEVTARAMRGELDFKESLRTRVACLKGVPVEQLQLIRNNIPLMPGLVNLLDTLKQHKWRIAIASGGFTYFADYLKDRLGLDECRANVLEEEQGKLTGSVIGDIVDAQAKALAVTQLGRLWSIEPGQRVAMGDGANDLAMMETAALGVACHAKPLVNQKADVAIRFGGLHTLLYYLEY